MRPAIDAIVEDFAPEMERITNLEGSKENKVRMAENWLRSRLEKFESDVRDDCAREK